MNKYMVLYLAPVAAEEQMMEAGSEEGQKVMAMWMAWYDKVGSAVVDGGTPLGKGMNVSKAGSGKPQANVTGYTIMQGESIEAIKKLVADHPHLMMPGASIEALELMPIEM